MSFSHAAMRRAGPRSSFESGAPLPRKRDSRSSLPVGSRSLGAITARSTSRLSSWRTGCAFRRVARVARSALALGGGLPQQRGATRPDGRPRDRRALPRRGARTLLGGPSTWPLRRPVFEALVEPPEHHPPRALLAPPSVMQLGEGRGRHQDCRGRRRATRALVRNAERARFASPIESHSCPSSALHASRAARRSFTPADARASSLAAPSTVGPSPSELR